MKNLRWIALAALIVLLLLGGCKPDKQPVVLADPPKPLAAAVEPTATPAPTNTPMLAGGSYISHYTPGQTLLIFDVGIRTLYDGWAIGRAAYEDNDHILVTSDAGHTWRDVTPPQPLGADLLRADGFFLDADTAFVVYSAADQFNLLDEYVVWRTRDRGQSWQISTPLELTGLEEFFVPDKISFADPQTGWVSVGIGAGMSHNFTSLYRTEDGGNTWARVLDPLNGEGLQTCEKTGLLFADSNSGWAGLNCHGLYPGVTFATTTDGGSTWQFVELPAPADKPKLFDEGEAGNCYTHSLHRFSYEKGMVGVTCEQLDLTEPADYYIYITEDGANNWLVLPVPPGTWHFYTFYQGYLIGNKIWHTNNQAGSVAAISDVQWYGSYDFINSQMGWAVSHEGGTSLYRTIDSGKTWEKINPVIGQ